ncbi:MAG: response regulator [Phycisphaerae bacterium]|nr:response regulator [Phycisphaerae bacterium]
MAGVKARIPVRTLVIDDDEAVCRSIQRWLSDAAHEVITFTRPCEGLQAASAVGCQLALVDLRLPDVAGPDIIASLTEVCPQTRIVAMSAFPDTPQVLAAVRAGARDLLTKPIQRDSLLATLERQLAELGIHGHTEHDFNQRLGTRLRAVRQEAKRTLSDVATLSGISAAQLSQIELGKNATTTWTLARISGALRVPLGKLFENI